MRCCFARNEIPMNYNLKTKIIDQNALEFLASEKDFIMDRIGDARNLNKNLEQNL